MTQFNGTTERGWQGWFGMWHFSSQDSRYAIQASSSTAVFMVLQAAAVVILEPEPGDYLRMPL